MTYLSKQMRAAAAATLLVTVGAVSPAVADDKKSESWLCSTVGVFCGDSSASKSDASADEADKGSPNAEDKAAKPAAGSDGAAADKGSPTATDAAAGAATDAAADKGSATATDAVKDAAGAAVDAVVTPAPAAPTP